MKFESSISPNENQGRFADLQEIEESCNFVDYRNKEAKNAGINVITDGVTSRVFESDDFTNVIGATGSRKTMTVVAPTTNMASHCLDLAIKLGEDYYRNSGNGMTTGPCTFKN